MKLLSVSLDEECRPVFFFSAPTRIDFRVLVSDLNKELNTKVSLRQVGARDEAKYIGGLGICGRKLCCASWLPCIPNVPTKLIRKQDLKGSPGQYTGVCGKLLCCLAYETEDLKLVESEKRADERWEKQEVEEERPRRGEPVIEGAAAEPVKDERKGKPPLEPIKPKKKPAPRRIVRKLRLKKK